MGIFDVFTGDAAKRAAAENTARLNAFKQEGMGYLDKGLKGGLASLDAARAAYQPYADKFSGGTDLYLDSLGVNGSEGNARAASAFQTNPGYDFMVNQSLDALDRRAASRGLLGSGNTSIDTMKTVTGYANQAYGDWQNKLGGLINPGMAAASGIAGVETGRAGLYGNDAQARVNLGQNVVTGANNQATQAANAQMQGGANLWGAGLSLASLGTGLLGRMAGTARA
jgi:hypothetical protein